MTEAFLGNPRSQTMKALVRTGRAAAGASSLWFGESIAATTEVANEIAQDQALNLYAESISLEDFQARVDKSKNTYPLHTPANVLDVSISMKKTGSTGFATSGMQK